MRLVTNVGFEATYPCGATVANCFPSLCSNCSASGATVTRRTRAGLDVAQELRERDVGGLRRRRLARTAEYAANDNTTTATAGAYPEQALA